MIMEFAANPPVYKEGRGINAEAQQKLREMIESGVVDIGPMPDHTAPVKDVRPKVDGETAWVFFKTANPDEFFGEFKLRGLVDNRNGTRNMP